MHLLPQRQNGCKRAVLISSVLTSLLVASVAVPGVQAYSVQPASIPDHPTEVTTGSLENLSAGVPATNDKIEMDGVVHLPLVRRPSGRSGSGWGVGRRKLKEGGSAASGSVALRDVQDITYNVLVKIGDITTPLVLDTGSSDMWALTDSSQSPACKACCGEDSLSPTQDRQSRSGSASRRSSSTTLSLYPVSSLLHTRVRGLLARLVYGDSMTGTQAEGVVARDRAGVVGAGVDLENQFFAAIDFTNTSVRETGSTGIFGLGFPISSMLWNELYSAQLAGYSFPSSTGTSQTRSITPAAIKRSGQAASSGTRRLPQVPGSQSSYDQDSHDEDSDGDEQAGRGQDYAADVAEGTGAFGSDFGSHPAMGMGANDVGRGGESPIPNVLASFEEFGPLIARLVMRSAGSGPCQISKMASPQISISLQRTAFGGDGSEEAQGMLTIGGPPSLSGRANAHRGQKRDAGLAWAPVRLYTAAQGGAALSEAPGEMYPYAWEAMMGDVWFNGVKLEKSRFGVMDVGTSALIDTGNSLIRGPADIISTILSSITHSTDDGGGIVRYPCADAQVLSFEFGGKRFDVDPRDFGSPLYAEGGDVLWCTPNLAPTDAPELGAYLYSWSLGDPFLKGVLSSFYYGNITHPSADSPRIGFASKVPSNAADLLRAEVAAASRSSRDSLEPTGSNMANGESTPKPIPENLFGQRLQPNSGELSRRRPPWIGSGMGMGPGSDVRVMGMVGSSLLFAVWFVVFGLIG